MRGDRRRRDEYGTGRDSICGAGRFGASQTFIAIDVMRMQPDFRERMDWLIEEVKSAAPAAGYDEVLVANEPELRRERGRLGSGIPVPDGTYEALRMAAARVGITEEL